MKSGMKSGAKEWEYRVVRQKMSGRQARREGIHVRLPVTHVQLVRLWGEGKWVEGE